MGAMEREGAAPVQTIESKGTENTSSTKGNTPNPVVRTFNVHVYPRGKLIPNTAQFRTLQVSDNETIKQVKDLARVALGLPGKIFWYDLRSQRPQDGILNVNLSIKDYGIEPGSILNLWKAQTVGRRRS